MFGTCMHIFTTQTGWSPMANSSPDSYKMFFFLKEKAETDCFYRDHTFRTLPKCSEKLIILAPWYEYLQVPIRG